MGCGHPVGYRDPEAMTCNTARLLVLRLPATGQHRAAATSLICPWLHRNGGIARCKSGHGPTGVLPNICRIDQSHPSGQEDNFQHETRA